MGEDWLHYHRAGTEFNLTVLVVNDTRLPLGSPHDRYMTVVEEEDIKLPPRIVVSNRGGLVTRKRKKGVVQLVPVEEVAL